MSDNKLRSDTRWIGPAIILVGAAGALAGCALPWLTAPIPTLEGGTKSLTGYAAAAAFLALVVALFSIAALLGHARRKAGWVAVISAIVSGAILGFGYMTTLVPFAFADLYGKTDVYGNRVIGPDVVHPHPAIGFYLCLAGATLILFGAVVTLRRPSALRRLDQADGAGTQSLSE